MFYTDLQQSFSYIELVQKLNSLDKVISNLNRFNTLDFYINLIGGLASGIDITLLDSDFSFHEIEVLTGKPYNQEIVVIPSLELDNLGDLISRVKNSPSKLTLFTSGTTGVPKMIVHSIESLTRNIYTDIRFRDNVWGATYNPTHMAGIQVFFQAFFNRSTLVNIFGLSKQDVFLSIEKFKISHISATPTFYRLLLPNTTNFSSVKQVTFGGEKSDITLHEKVAKIFPDARIRNVYASTEAGALFAAKDDGFVIPERLKDKIKIEHGELYIHKTLLGKTNSLNNLTTWYASGDMVEFLDEEKQIFQILGRKSEMINVAGYKVNPHEVESALSRMEGIKESKVYGKPNSVLGNILCAEIVRSDNSISESEIKIFLASFLQGFKVPRKIFFKDEIPLSRTGKIDRKNVE